ncbi:MAG: tryptophan synthase subunit alpha [Candidatus Nanopelagicaceae bacterium]|nr:tryptophan synthase subunit alpha [Candidatus Nanopelagicaceae bacterium]
MNSKLQEVFAKAKSENRAALIGYMPAGFPTLEGSKEIIAAMISGGVDIVEVGFPYSDPVMDGPVIQQAAEVALRNQTSATDVFNVISSISVPALVMSYWNPIERTGVESFTKSLAQSGGAGVITPDLTIEESNEWYSATDHNQLGRVYVVAPSSSDERLEKVAQACSGFVYAASLMGVTGARATVSDAAEKLVERVRKVTTLPVAVGLGVSTREQAKQVARYADGVIVGSAFIKLILESASEKEGLEAVKVLASELAKGVRGA